LFKIDLLQRKLLKQ